MINDDFINGFIEKSLYGDYSGELSIEGIDLSPVQAQYFKKDLDTYLWIKRKDKLIYDADTQTYVRKQRTPKLDCYLKKCVEDNKVVYRGEFYFMHFKFSITGLWDKVVGVERSRLNLFVERLPIEQQTIINNIKNRRENGS